MRVLAMLGAGGHGRVVADCALECGFERVEVFDDHIPLSIPEGSAFAGSGSDLLARHREYDGVIVAIGENVARLERHRALTAAGASMAILVHPHASVSRHARLGFGTVVCAGGVVTVGAELGQAVVVNTGATIDHDCRLADGVHVAPGAHLAGGVQVGEGTWIGVGAAVREYVTIGNRVFIGAGAVVVKSIADGLTVVGNPARPQFR